MSRYHVDTRMAGSQQALAAGFKTAISVFNGSGGAGVGGRIVSIAVGLDGQPNSTDTQVIFAVNRMTADGTGTTTTAKPLREAYVAKTTLSTVKSNYSAEPTYTAPGQIWIRVLNQRASMQWAAQDQDAYLEFMPAGAAGATPNGVVIIGSGGTTPVTANQGVAAEFDE